MEEPPAEELRQEEQEQLENLGLQHSEPQDMEIWCLIVGMIGTAFPVIVKGTDRVWELQKTIKNEAVEIFRDFNAAQLRLYLAKKDNGQWLSAAEVTGIENGNAEPARPLLARGHLASMSQLAGILKDRDANAVHILVPAPSRTSEIEVEPDTAGKRKRSEQSIIGDVETMGVSAEELKVLFDVLGQKMQTEHRLVATHTLHEFLQGFGGFPPSYFVRKEELVLWGLVMRILSEREKRVVIMGSAGVGKSCFIMLLSTGTYWRPECVDFPFVDAVVVCEATLRGSGMKEKIVACISTTVGDKKVFQPDIWRKLNKALDKSGSISTSDPRVFVVVGPDASTCKRVTLVDAPSPDEFMVCCFDPLKLPRKPALPF
ncbi:hypothetical protein PF005_g4430 [Phytophthora fragariae]|uniref:Crinkler effector protein N-terminal domain-containing protein n=1 Tax=Phytophthora fragariae TaxID=53985 RepID=A0A6A3TLD0_9STRA|nr:hypothetical protein PF009_g4663 [Phytophthora fragariae]KAE9137943.1 hypothetical protein PF007_g1621 [Phytophthora fragariae]KAE9151446.1 hypothetical protein PF006_g4274 [Phytophthora fragariae]KAE9228187.1 hypothetical protein PF005_g4430 [Phytophthora fragariae]